MSDVLPSGTSRIEWGAKKVGRYYTRLDEQIITSSKETN